MHPTLIQLGPITLHTYGLLVAVGIFLSIGVLRSVLGRRGVPSTEVESLAVILILCGFLGARVAFFLVENPLLLKADPLSFFRVWEGGLVFYGGVVAGLAALWVFARRRGRSYLSWTDALAPALLLGHAIGRLGCFAAGCCYGRPTDDPLGVTFHDPASLAPTGVPLHPTQLYESAGTFILFLVALRLSGRSARTGTLTVFYLLGYGAMRFALEFLRGDDRGRFVAGLSPSQWVALALSLTGAILLIWIVRASRAVRPRADPHIHPSR